MGGGNSGGGYPGVPGASSRDKCDITFDTSIFSPVPEVVESLVVGDLLDVSLVQGTTGGHASVVFLHQGVPAGSLAGTGYLPTLISCLQDGVLYVAEVLAISGSHVMVKVFQQ